MIHHHNTTRHTNTNQTPRIQSLPHIQDRHTYEPISGISTRNLKDAVERAEQLSIICPWLDLTNQVEPENRILFICDWNWSITRKKKLYTPCLWLSLTDRPRPRTTASIAVAFRLLLWGTTEGKKIPEIKNKNFQIP